MIVVLQLLAVPFKSNRPCLHHVVLLGQLQGQIGILFDEQNRNPFIGNAFDDGPNLTGQNR